MFIQDGEPSEARPCSTGWRDPRALHETQRYYAMRLADARFLTPSPEISRGVVWAKCNMLRIIKEYPQGWGSTNSPPSDILVSRDTSWFVHGFDYFIPGFSRDALDLFNRNVEDSGQVVEYVRGVFGLPTSYDLNINDDTPLHLIAILHHYNATLDKRGWKGCCRSIVKIADYILSQRNENGLVWCSARVRICAASLPGATSSRITRSTAPSRRSTRSACSRWKLRRCCARSRGIGTTGIASGEAAALRAAMKQHLYNEETGAFVLNWDRDGAFQDNFTADEIFPVLFGVADPKQRRRDPRALAGA